MWTSSLRDLTRDETAATAIGYGLIVALVSTATITALTSLGTSLTSTYIDVSEALNCGANPPSCAP